MSRKLGNNLETLLRVKNQTDDTADLYIFGDIVCDSWSKWQEEDKYPLEIKNFLDEVKGKNLNVYINSGGGSVFAGMAIYSMLKRHDGFKTAYVDGLAGSISSVIPFACDKVVIPSNAYFMIHKPWCLVNGNANVFEEYIELLNKVEDGIINVYMENAKDGVTEEIIRQFVDEETWFTGREAAEYFNVEVAQELNAVAFVGDYVDVCAKTPNVSRSQVKYAIDEEIDKCRVRLKLLNLKGV